MGWCNKCDSMLLSSKSCSCKIYHVKIAEWDDDFFEFYGRHVEHAIKNCMKNILRDYSVNHYFFLKDILEKDGFATIEVLQKDGSIKTYYVTGKMEPVFHISEEQDD